MFTFCNSHCHQRTGIAEGGAFGGFWQCSVSGSAFQPFVKALRHLRH